ncbi:MAG: hypothetical protein AAFS13_10560 [Pseudomonadota bacterium]
MKDHFELLLDVEPAANISAAEGNRLVKQTNKLLLSLLKAAPLDQVRALPAQVRGTLSGRLDVSFTFAELKAISKAWEPKRKIEDGETQTDLGRNLTSLMMGERKPYIPVGPRLTLKAARERSYEERAEITARVKRWAPKADLKRLAKKWDSFNTAIQTAHRDRQVEHILALLEGRADPQPKPARK